MAWPPATHSDVVDRIDGISPTGAAAVFFVPEPITSPGRYTQVGYGPPATGGAASSWDEITYTPWVIDRTVSLTRIGVEVTTISGAAAAPRIAIYGDTSGKPGALILDCGSVDSTTLGIKELTIAQSLNAGRYWLAWWWGNVAGAQIRLNATSAAPVGTTLTALLASNYAYLGLGAPAATANTSSTWDKCPRFFVKT